MNDSMECEIMETTNIKMTDPSIEETACLGDQATKKMVKESTLDINVDEGDSEVSRVQIMDIQNDPGTQPIIEEERVNTNEEVCDVTNQENGDVFPEQVMSQEPATEEANASDNTQVVDVNKQSPSSVPSQEAIFKQSAIDVISDYSIKDMSVLQEGKEDDYPELDVELEDDDEEVSFNFNESNNTNVSINEKLEPVDSSPVEAVCSASITNDEVQQIAEESRPKRKAAIRARSNFPRPRRNNVSNNSNRNRSVSPRKRSTSERNNNSKRRKRSKISRSRVQTSKRRTV